MLWVLDALDDVESDLSRFHRIDDMHAMPGPKFFRYINRLIFYDGAVAAMVRMKAQGDVPAVSAVPVAAPAQMSVPSGAQVVPAVPAALRMSDLGSLLSFGTG